MSRLVLVATSLAPVTAWAHPGHGALDVARYGVVGLVAVIASIAAFGWSKARATRA